MNGPDFRSIRPTTAADLAEHDMVGERLFDDQELPLVLEPSLPDLDLAAWARNYKDRVDALLAQYGALLFRGFAVGPDSGFGDFAAVIGSGALSYMQRSTRRQRVGEGVYTSTEYPATHSIALHSENAFQYEWPTRVMFHSVVAAETGGATPVADNVAIYDAIDPDVRDEFVTRGIMYLRNFGAGTELSWQEAFQTEAREDVEDYCRGLDIEWEWKNRDRLGTRQVLPAAIRLPDGRPAWFNQLHLFHVTNLAPDIREALLAAMPEEDLPRHAYFGDGGAIPESHLDNIRAAFASRLRRFPWQHDDVMLLDNLRTCHGRDPFTGPRTVLVSMSDPADYGQCGIAPTASQS